MKIAFLTGENIELPFDSLVASNLDNLNLHRVNFEFLDISNASCKNTDFRGGLLASTNFTKSDLFRANMITTFAISANFSYVNLEEAIMISCQLQGANLRFANLNNAIVRDANFSNCQLQGCIMTCKEIEEAIFTDALYDDSTIWPEGFVPENVGCIYSTL